MQESYRKGVATILTPSHARAAARLHLKRWTGAYVGWVLSSENGNPGSRRRQPVRKATTRCALTQVHRGPAESKTPCTHKNSMRENRETPLPPAAKRRRVGWRRR